MNHLPAPLNATVRMSTSLQAKFPALQGSMLATEASVGSVSCEGQMASNGHLLYAGYGQPRQAGYATSWAARATGRVLLCDGRKHTHDLEALRSERRDREGLMVKCS